MSSRWHFGYAILALAVMAVFIALGLGRFGYAMVLPAMQQALDLTNTQTGVLQSWNLLGYVLCVGVAGVLATRFGPRVVIAAALVLVGVAMICTGLFPTFPAACAGRFFAGAGGAAANVPAMGMLAAWFAARRRGLAAGTAVAGSSLGLAATGSSVPAILDRFGPDGWWICWVLFGTTALVASVLTAVFLRNRPEELGLQPLGATAAATSRASSSAASTSWAQVYRSSYLWHLSAVYFAFGFSYIIYSTFFVKHLVKDLGLTTAAAGGLWMQIGLGSIVSGFLWGALSDRWGRRPVLVCIFVVQALSFLTLGLTHGRAGAWGSAALFAVTAWSIPAVMAAIAGDVFGPRLAPTALGLMTVVFGVGQAVAPYVGGWLADRTQSFAPAFVLAGGVALLLGAGGALLLPRSARAPETE